MRRGHFSPDDPVLPMNYPGFVFRTLVDEGHSSRALLDGTGLTEQRLSDPAFRCGFAPLRRFFLNAIDTTEDPHLGVTLGRRFEPTYIGLPAYTAMNAATLSDSLSVLARFFFLTFPAIDFAVDAGGSARDAGTVAIRLRPKIPLGDIAYFASMSALVACNGLLRSILRTEQAALRAEAVGSRPDGWDAVAERVGFPISFGAADNRLVIPDTLLGARLPAADPINHTRLLALCEAFAAESPFETTTVSRVLAFLDADGNLKAPMAATAAALGYSERGLRRQLQRSGTTYRTLVEEVCARRAQNLLMRSGLPVQTIAYDLGFDTPSNFARSFKRWTGTTPTAFRGGRHGDEGAGQN